MSNQTNSKPIVENYLNSTETTSSGSIKVLCKFVILKCSGQLIFLWGRVADYPYHANLIEKYCQNHNIPCDWANRPTLLDVYDEDTKIRGGGYAEIQNQRQMIFLGGRSTAYGKFVRSELKDILAENHLLDGFSCSIQEG